MPIFYCWQGRDKTPAVNKPTGYGTKWPIRFGNFVQKITHRLKGTVSQKLSPMLMYIVGKLSL